MFHPKMEKYGYFSLPVIFNRNCPDRAGKLWRNKAWKQY